MGKTSSKLLVICGPTATGKTALAISLAQKFDAILVSADSRMVYKHMDIGTGKDIEKYGKILGYDLVDPNEEFSVSQYSLFAQNTIKKIIEQKKLPILVGGSGLYIKAVVDGIATSNIPPNEVLRENLRDKTAEQLFKILKNSDSKKALEMNDSDRKNPRRLIRAIEIAGKNINTDFPQYDVLMIGLSLEKQELEHRIKTRVEQRIKEGMEKEIEYLKSKNFWNGAPSMTIGYKDFPDLGKWKTEEIKYAKRQTTWFKKDKRIKWFDAGKSGFEKDVEKLTQKWYSQENAQN